MKIRILDEDEGPEFVSWLISQGYDAELQPASRHSSGGDIVEDYDEDREELIDRLWTEYCQS